MPKGIPNKRYTPEFKQMVVETMREEHLSVREAMRRFEISDHGIIERWERIYLEEGPEGLALERRGRKRTDLPAKLPKKIEEDLIAIAQLPRATFYYHLKRTQRADKYAGAKEEITSIYHKNKGRYGYRRITEALCNKGIHLNHKAVQRLMKELGLVCRVRIKKYHSYKGEVGKIAPNLLNRDFHAERPNQKWVTDVTAVSYTHLTLPTTSRV